MPTGKLFVESGKLVEVMCSVLASHPGGVAALFSSHFDKQKPVLNTRMKKPCGWTRLKLVIYQLAVVLTL